MLCNKPAVLQIFLLPFLFCGNDQTNAPVNKTYASSIWVLSNMSGIYECNGGTIEVGGVGDPKIMLQFPRADSIVLWHNLDSCLFLKSGLANTGSRRVVFNSAGVSEPFAMQSADLRKRADHMLSA